jgi:hypothetical protein
MSAAPPLRDGATAAAAVAASESLSASAAKRCLNCDTPLAGAYCHVCGQRGSVQRFTLRGLLHEVPHAVFHVDRGLWATLRQLLRRPGTTINAYLDGKRIRFFNPLTLLFLSAGVSALLYSSMPFDQYLSANPYPGELGEKWVRFNQLSFRYYSLSLVVWLPLLSSITWLAFLNRRRGFGEHLIINAFVVSVQTVIVITFAPALVVMSGLGFALLWIAMTGAMTVYQGVAYAAVFSSDGRRWSAALLATLVVILYLGTVTALSHLVLWPLYLRLTAA